MKQYQWNLSYQWQFMPRMLLDVTYTGNVRRHIWIAGYRDGPGVAARAEGIRVRLGLGPLERAARERLGAALSALSEVADEAVLTVLERRP